MRKAIALMIGALSFLVFFIDEIYRLRSLEWAPEILGPMLIVLAINVWNPGTFTGKRNRPGETGRVDNSSIS